MAGSRITDTEPRSPLVGVDWGTSAMRAMLCHAGGNDPEVVTGPGVTAVQGAFAATLFSAIEPWTRTYGRLPVIMSGMIGSNVGWQVVPYLECPFPVRSLGSGIRSFHVGGHRVSIVPGLACRNVLRQPDYMRGEELQILGWLEQATGRSEGEHVLCLPGTHTKWVRFSGGCVETFLTSLGGELYAVLREHSILVSATARATRESVEEQAFAEGLEAARRSGGDLLSALFSVRSRQIADPGAAGKASGYLSGLVIGADVMSGTARFAIPGGVVELIGDAALCRKFAGAMEYFGMTARVTDGIDAARRGFRFLAEPRS